MSDYVLFKKWGPWRESLIAGHLFYVEQARMRLLSQFADIEAEADKAAEDWLERSGGWQPHRYRPFPYRVYDAAGEDRIEFYALLSRMRDQTRLGVAAGMFHEWNNQLRDWMVREIQNWNSAGKVASEVRNADFKKIIQLLDSFGLNILSTEYYHRIDALYHLVNVYKHGTGRSLDKLKLMYPDYLIDPSDWTGRAISHVEHLDHTDLRVSEAQIQAFSDAIVAFWRSIPDYVVASSISDPPEWFVNALGSGRAGQAPETKR
jgi:hypothetical protein